MTRFFHRRRGFTVIAFAAFATAGCSLFVDLSDLNDGANSNDASTADTSAPDGGSTQDASASDAPLDAPTCAPGTRVQFAFSTDDGGNGSTLSAAMPQTEHANDFVVVGTNYDTDCTGVESVTDTAGNSYKNLVAPSGNDNAGNLETWGAADVLAVTNNVVTVHFSSDCGGRNLKVVEYAGVDTVNPVDPSTASQFGGPGTEPDAGITASGPAILFAHSADARTCHGPGAGWTEIFIDNWATIAEEQILTTGGNFIVSAQMSADDDWGIQAVSLRACKSP